MELHIRRFGSPAREVLGLLQRPQPDKLRKVAFLMCRPFGQESVRTAPVYRAMSDRLAREGCPVLAFDAYGCGDSPGEPDDQALADWVEDTLAADRQLRQDAPGVPVHWFGMRLGANIAADAAMRAERAPACLVLWEPILDGPSYLERLLSMHRAELSREMQRDWLDLRTRGGEAEPVLPGSVLGFAVGARLHNELQHLHNVPLHSVSRRGTRTVVALGEQERQGLAALNIDGLTLQPIETPTNWMSIEARGTAIVPQQLSRTLLATLQSPVNA